MFHIFTSDSTFCQKRIITILMYNFPFGIYQIDHQKPRLASILGDYVIDLAAMNALGFFHELNIAEGVFENNYLNDFIALGKKTTNRVRAILIDTFNNENSGLAVNEEYQKLILKNYQDVKMLMPIKVGNYTDFYSSIQHATNVGTMFRDPKNALLPNYKHIPIPIFPCKPPL